MAAGRDGRDVPVDDRLREDVFWPRLRRALALVDEDERTPPPNARVGAVLVLLEPSDRGPRIVLTRRRADLRSHPGQISFPGGRLDADETIEEAALREAEEEIGLRSSTVEVVGAGPTFYIPPSRFWVVPVVARWTHPHRTDPNPWEVDEVLRVPVAQLLEPDRWRQVPLSLRGSSWAWQLDDDLLWGATAMVMALLLEVAVEDWSQGLSPEDLDDARTVRPWEKAPAWQRRARLEGDLPAVAQESVVHVTAAQMTAVSSELVVAGVTFAATVEHAGRAIAHAVRRLVGTSLAGVRVTVLAGPGGNGVGGLAAARLLAVGGAEVTVLLTGRQTDTDAGRALAAADVEVIPIGDDPAGRDPGEVVVDAMLGTGGDPPLRGVVEQAAAWLRRHDVPVVALDLPSGLHPDDGLRGPCVTADVTVTLAAPKQGLLPKIAHPYIGDLYLADLGVPAGVWEAAGVTPVTVFDRGPLVRLTTDDTASDADTPDQAVIPEP